MKTETILLTAAGLLHDMGKVIYRAGIIDGRSHSVSGADFIKDFTLEKEIVECIRYHHGRDLRRAKLDDDCLAYITYIADNISAGSDRREKEVEGEPEALRFDKSLPLESVFNILNLAKSGPGSEPRGAVYRACALDAEIAYPEKMVGKKLTSADYNRLYQEIKGNLQRIDLDGRYLASLLEITEAYLSFVPSSTETKQLADISLFDHQKTTAAISTCIFLYLDARGEKDYQKTLLKESTAFYGEAAFLMVSLDFSGIQDFIFNIPSDKALKRMRARSFYLEMLMEHLCDELLTAVGVSRTNLIYTGGGHAYLLLPNTQEVVKLLADFDKLANAWLVDTYGTGLYLAVAAVPCSGNDLMNIPALDAPYKAIYSKLSRQLGLKKMQRYNAETIIALNRGEEQTNKRECRVCGAVAQLLENQDICGICAAFAKIAEKVIREDLIIIASPKELADLAGFEMPAMAGRRWLYFVEEAEARKILKDTEGDVRVYSKNKRYTGVNYATRLWVGDYIWPGGNTLEDLAAKSEGIDRLAVLRADVDNLGAAFMMGFDRPGSQDKAEKHKHSTLSRTAAFSRQMSLFFKYYINQILQGNFGERQFSITGESSSPPLLRPVAIVYAGGDDVFLVGAWNHVVEAAVDLKKSFAHYCLESMTISAGVGIYDHKYPISRMAHETGELEEKSKAVQEKNSVTLFTDGLDAQRKPGEDHTYRWEELENEVVGEKLKTIREFFENGEKGEQERGRAFLYNILMLLRGSEKKINLARLAYQLARLEPKPSSPAYEAYKRFAVDMYRWALNEKDKKQAITALYLYVYLKREKEVERIAR